MLFPSLEIHRQQDLISLGLQWHLRVGMSNITERNERYSVILVKLCATPGTIEKTPPLFIGETQKIYYALPSMAT